MALCVDPEFKSLIPPLSAEERAGLEADIVRDGRATVALVVWGDVLLDGHNRFEICEKHRLPYTTSPAPEWIKDRRDARIWIRTTSLNRRNLPDLVRIGLARGNEPDIAAKNADLRLATLKQNRPAPSAQATIPTTRPVEQGGEPATGEAATEVTFSGGGAGTAPSVTDEQNFAHRRAPQTRAQAAAQAGVSHPTYMAGCAVIDKGTPKLQAAVNRGEVTIYSAAALVDLPPEKQDEIAGLGKKAAVAAAKAVKQAKLEERRVERVEKIAEISKGNKVLSLPTRYPVLLADPPWKYEHCEADNRAIENQYPTMDLESICTLPVADIVTPDAVLFLWATSPKLAESMQVVERWGFTYRTCMVWVKDKIGMGYYARQRHELLLIATRGSPPVPAPGDRPDSVLEGPRMEHSAKPMAAYEVIERMYPDWPRLEMFCRSPRAGWQAWGNQANGAAA